MPNEYNLAQQNHIINDIKKQANKFDKDFNRFADIKANELDDAVEQGTEHVFKDLGLVDGDLAKTGKEFVPERWKRKGKF